MTLLPANIRTAKKMTVSIIMHTADKGIYRFQLRLTRVITIYHFKSSRKDYFITATISSARNLSIFTDFIKVTSWSSCPPLSDHFHRHTVTRNIRVSSFPLTQKFLHNLGKRSAIEYFCLHSAISVNRSTFSQTIFQCHICICSEQLNLGISVFIDGNRVSSISKNCWCTDRVSTDHWQCLHSHMHLLFAPISFLCNKLLIVRNRHWPIIYRAHITSRFFENQPAHRLQPSTSTEISHFTMRITESHFLTLSLILILQNFISTFR